MGIEDPDADVVEQQRSVDDLEDDPAADVTTADGLPAEADPADVAEQRMIVPQDIDEP
jgi:hypothetical protein